MAKLLFDSVLCENEQSLPSLQVPNCSIVFAHLRMSEEKSIICALMIDESVRSVEFSACLTKIAVTILVELAHYSVFGCNFCLFLKYEQLF